MPKVFESRRASVGSGQVRRLLPHPRLRRVGAWCLVDHFGPAASTGTGAGPHPHTGLQTVTWLLDGRMHHGDSLGSSQAIVPGQLNLMTAGRGITHWEREPGDGTLTQGVQLWIALPESHRTAPAAFEHHDSLPRTSLGGWSATVLVGSFAGHVSPATVHTPLVGVELVGTGALKLRLEPSFEYAVLVLEGEARVAGESAGVGQLVALSPHETSLRIDAWVPARVLLLGGEPFAEPRVMWWNFLGATHADVVEAAHDWGEGHPRFGLEEQLPDSRIPAPSVPGFRMVPR